MAIVAECSSFGDVGPGERRADQDPRLSSTTSWLVPSIPSPETYAPETSPVPTDNVRTVDVALARLRFGQPDGAHLRVGERHPRDAVARNPVPRVLAENDVAGDARLVLAHVSEQRPPVAVADRVQPVTVDSGRAQLVVDLDEVAGLETDGLQTEIRRWRVVVRRRPGSRRPRTVAAVGECRRHGPVNGAFSRRHAHPDDDPDPFGFEAQRPPALPRTALRGRATVVPPRRP